MKPKILIGILFLVIFSTSFLVYLFVVNVVTPHFDLSTTAKQKLEIAPELQDTAFEKDSELTNIQKLQQKAMNDLETQEKDVSSAMGDDSYVPMEELTKGDDEENMAGVLDTEDISNVRAPGDERHVQQVSSSDSVLPKSDQDNKQEVSTSDSNKVNTAFIPDSNVTDPILDEKPVTLNRVVVGSYASIDQAKEAYDKMVDSDLEVAPIIKEVQGNYTLQVGAFTDKEKANKLVDTLKNKQYSAEIKPE